MTEIVNDKLEEIKAYLKTVDITKLTMKELEAMASTLATIEMSERFDKLKEVEKL